MTEKKDSAQQQGALKKLQEYMDGQHVLMTVEQDDLNSAFCTQATLFFNASRRHARAEQILAEQKKYLEEMIGRKDIEIRESQAKTTEEFVKQAIRRDDEANRQRDVVISAQYQAECYKSLVRSFEHRRDMLIQLGANYRAEMTQNISINREGYEKPTTSRAAEFAPGPA